VAHISAAGIAMALHGANEALKLRKGELDHVNSEQASSLQMRRQLQIKDEDGTLLRAVSQAEFRSRTY
jgi:hypothetical protein